MLQEGVLSFAVSLFAIPKVRDHWFDCQKDGYDDKYPDIALCEIREIYSGDHTDENATPLKASDVNRRPYF